MYLYLKYAHIGLAALAISGFLLRGLWRATGSALYRTRAARTLPHINDALFLGSGIWLVMALNLPWLQSPWLLAKFAGLLAYVGFGMVAFRFGRSEAVQLVAFVELSVNTTTGELTVSPSSTPGAAPQRPWAALGRHRRGS